MPVCRTRMRITMRRTRTRISGRVWTTTKGTEIGVQQWGRVPDAVPREQSLTKSGLTWSQYYCNIQDMVTAMCRKGEKRSDG